MRRGHLYACVCVCVRALHDSGLEQVTVETS